MAQDLDMIIDVMSQSIQAAHRGQRETQMSKKHFEALAAALKSTQPSTEAGNAWAAREAKRIQWRASVEAVANTCACFNPNFDRARFLKACGVGV